MPWKGDPTLAITDFPGADPVNRPDRLKLADILGPGLITGASDDDPSGIATYARRAPRSASHSAGPFFSLTR